MNEILLANKYYLKEKIYDGKYSKVYIGQHKYKKEEVIIKLEHNESSKLLQNEANIYLYLMKVKNKEKINIPNFKFFGIIENYDYIILEKMEYSLNDILNKNINFELNDILKIGIQLFDLLKKFHQQNLIHRDIKPENLIFDDKNNLFLIDFGLSTMYKKNVFQKNDETSHSKEFKKYIESKGKNKFVGNYIYASPYIHEGYDYYPKDDLISVVYILLYLYYKKLPWTLFKYIKNQNEISNQLKKNIDIIDFYKDSHGGNKEECKKFILIQLYYQIINLTYDTDIQYENYKYILYSNMNKKSNMDLKKFSWGKLNNNDDKELEEIE